ncbi:MAG: winged helix-turn-helix transcriptional regulator [Gammaproteobacteria bacterium]|nr:MAG: winged helix-turn-helix transcriptional regulator [Gammaproteobacteria bacterium]
MTHKTLDRIDLAILRELQANARITNAELSRRVNLSPSPCLERVRRLEERGYIRGYFAHLNARRLKTNLVVFIEINLERTAPGVFADFKAAAMRIEEIQECHLVSGNFDYLIKARVADMEAYRRFLGETVLELPHVRESRSYVVMETVKETLSIPLGPRLIED